jgi:hypothetical protein
VDYDAGLRRAYTANGIGSMTVIQQDSADQYRVKVRFRNVAAIAVLSVDTSALTPNIRLAIPHGFKRNRCGRSNPQLGCRSSASRDEFRHRN